LRKSTIVISLVTELQIFVNKKKPEPGDHVRTAGSFFLSIKFS
jgi:hypothetical protein